MNQIAHDALVESIKVWEEKVRTLESNINEDMPLLKMGAKSCPLCEEFIMSGCAGCPVFAKTGEDSCEYTPYYATSLAYSTDTTVTENTIKLFRDELNFLKSLLQEVDE